MRHSCLAFDAMFEVYSDADRNQMMIRLPDLWMVALLPEVEAVLKDQKVGPRARQWGGK